MAARMLAGALVLLCAAGFVRAAPAGGAVHTMQALPEQTLADISAGDGIALNLEYRINADAAGNPVACPTAIMHSNGTPDCRLAMSFSDRLGIWLVMKDYRGILKLNNIWIDAVNSPPTYTTYTNNGAALNPYLQGYDPRNKPMMQLTAGNWATALAGGVATYNTYLNSNTYGDAAMFVNIARLTAEYNCGTINYAGGIHTACGSTIPGYLRDAVTGAAISLRTANGVVNPNDPAQVRLDGRLQIFGYTP